MCKKLVRIGVWMFILVTGLHLRSKIPPVELGGVAGKPRKD